jgi:hypothetical protein
MLYHKLSTLNFLLNLKLVETYQHEGEELKYNEMILHQRMFVKTVRGYALSTEIIHNLYYGVEVSENLRNTNLG